MKKPWHRMREYELLNRMLDDAIAGTFEESVYDESELSKLSVKWKRYLSKTAREQAKIEQERENLKQLITNISHQTRTPLTNVLLYAQLLEEQIPDGDSRAYVEEILTYSQKLEVLLESMVKMSRMEAGVFTYVTARKPLEDLADAVVGLGLAKAKEKNITIRCAYQDSEEELPVCASYDMKWTTEAVYNILDNAVKYSDAGSTITVRMRGYELFSCIEIEDEGTGIVQDEIPRIFGRFYRGENVHDKEGIGVGLFLAREIVQGQGGYIKVKSEPGSGAVFGVFLPV